MALGQSIEIELMLADIQTLENSLSKAERTAKSGDKEAKHRAEEESAEQRLALHQPHRPWDGHMLKKAPQSASSLSRRRQPRDARKFCVEHFRRQARSHVGIGVYLVEEEGPYGHSKKRGLN